MDNIKSLPPSKSISFAGTLRRERTTRKWSMRELGRRSGTTAAMISSYESALLAPSPTSYDKLNEALFGSEGTNPLVPLGQATVKQLLKELEMRGVKVMIQST